MSDLTPLPPSIFIGSKTEKPNASYGALISIILILAIVVVGAFYVWGKRISERTPSTVDQPIGTQAVPVQ